MSEKEPQAEVVGAPPQLRQAQQTPPALPAGPGAAAAPLPPLALTVAVDRRTGAYTLAHNVQRGREAEDLEAGLAALEGVAKALRQELVMAKVAREIAARAAQAKAEA